MADGRRHGGRRPGRRARYQVTAAPTTIAHGVLVGWSAARAEHRNLVWKSARELAFDRERWAVPMRRERGYADELPDVAVWLEGSKTPGAVIAESGGRREDRQKMILERLARRDLVRPLPRGTMRLREPIGRPLDQPSREEGRADRFGLHGSRANDRRAARRPLPHRPDKRAGSR